MIEIVLKIDTDGDFRLEIPIGVRTEEHELKFDGTIYHVKLVLTDTDAEEDIIKFFTAINVCSYNREDVKDTVEKSIAEYIKYINKYGLKGFDNILDGNYSFYISIYKTTKVFIYKEK